MKPMLNRQAVSSLGSGDSVAHEPESLRWSAPNRLVRVSLCTQILFLFKNRVEVDQEGAQK